MVKKEPDGLTLTKLTKVGRNVVKYGVMFLVLLMVGRVTLIASVAYWKATHPPPPPPPTRGFGALPPILYPDQLPEDKPKSYKLETARGTLPVFGDRAFVYLMPKNSPSLMDNENAKVVANKYGFVFEPEPLDQRTYRWTKSQPLNTTFELDILNYNFDYETDFLNHPELILETDVPTDFDSVRQVKSFLSQSGLLPPDIATASGTVTYLKAVGGALKPAVSVSDADFVQVDINRIQVDNRYSIYTPDGITGTIHAIINGSRSTNILRLIRRYYVVDYSQVHTYPIRSAASAWQTMQAGEGYVASNTSEEQAIIRTVELGYFDSFEQQEYFQPVYVFKGDNGFIGYVSAIDPSDILQSSNSRKTQ